MNMMVLGLTVALLWGGADILSTYVDMDALRTTLMAQGIGLMTLVLALACLLVLWPMNSPVLVVHLPLLTLIIFGILLGGVSACSYLALYFALRRGPLAIVSPVVAAQGGVTTVGAVLVLHEHLRVAQLVAILLLIGGVMAAAGVRTAPLSKSTSPLQRTKLWRRGWQWMRQSAPGIAGGLVAMFGFGVLSLGLGAATAIDGLAGAMAMLISMRLFSVFFLAILASLSGSPSEPHKAPTPRSWIIAGIVGAFEIGGLALFSSTVLLSSTALAGILSSVYPVFPLLYAFLFKRERLSRLQLAGTFCIVVGLGLLSSELPLPLSSSVGGGLLVLLGGIIWFPCLKQLILRMRRRNVGVTTPEMDQVLTETVTILNTFLLFHRAVSPASAKESVGKREAS